MSARPRLTHPPSPPREEPPLTVHCVQCGEDPEPEDSQQAHLARRIFIVCTPDNCIWSISELVRPDLPPSDHPHPTPSTCAPYQSGMCTSCGAVLHTGRGHRKLVAAVLRAFHTARSNP